MGERKVLNKYYPPDFDPAKIPKRKQLKNLQMKVRMMLPMSIRCNTCGTYMYKGTKFNCRKEDVQDDTYLGLMKFRFYFKCTKCSAELVMKTDPKNSDYEMEFGASRNFEPWREADEVKEAAKKQREEEEMGDAMKALENRTMDSKMEMDIMASLDEVKSLRARQAHIDQDTLLQALKRSAEQGQGQKTEQELDDEDEKTVREIFFGRSQQIVKRIEDDEDDDEPNDDGGVQASKHLKNSSSDRGGTESLTEGCLLGKDASKRQYNSSDADQAPKRQKQTSVEAYEASQPTSSAVRIAGNPTTDGIMLKRSIEEIKPVFEFKPLPVAFAVKKKGAASGGTAPKSPTVVGSLLPKVGVSASAAGTGSEESAKGHGASVSHPGGLSLLSNYSDSDDSG